MNKYQSSKTKTDCMTKEPITFDKLPQAVSYLTEQVEKIYQLVETLQPRHCPEFCVNGNRIQL